MWFDDDISGRVFKRRRNQRRTPVLSVRARVSTKKKINTHRAGAFVLIPVITLVAGAVMFLAVRAAGRALFSENDNFMVKHVEVRAGSEVTRERVKEYTRIAEGMNIFGFRIQKVCRSVLQDAHSFKSLTISRELPDTVRIEVVEREPLARLGPRGFLVADREGYVFAGGGKARDLPGLIGLPDISIKPGERLGGMAGAALQVLDVCDDPRLELGISAIRVDDAEALHIQITRNGRHQEAPLTWKDMGKGTPESRRDLIRKIINLKRALESDEGRRLTSFDATFPDRIYGH